MSLEPWQQRILDAFENGATYDPIRVHYEQRRQARLLDAALQYAFLVMEGWTLTISSHQIEARRGDERMLMITPSAAQAREIFDRVGELVEHAIWRRSL